MDAVAVGARVPETVRATAVARAAPAVPFLLEGTRGPLCAVYHPPLGTPHPMGDVLVVPAFAEEMNRCRAMVTLQARAFAQLGIGTLVLDPYGTGDSAGEFVDATWDGWRDDLLRGLAWLRTHGRGCRTLWAMRLGAVMASQLARLDGGIERLLLWQPVLDAKQFYTQFLRIRIAAELQQADRVKSTNELRQWSARGDSIEVSGYRIGPTLARELDEQAFDAAALAAPMKTLWFDVLPDAESEVAPPTRAAVERLRGAGAEVDFATAVGPAFWQVHEREIAPALIAAGGALAEGWAGPIHRAGVMPDRPRAVAAPSGEEPLAFDCAGEQLIGTLHRGAARARRGFVIVVAGGPQYRAGAHRQFVTMARRLAAQGFPVLRFDLRGMGDSSGEYRGYKDSEPDIRAAIDTLLRHERSVQEVVLLGECESASGILFYAWRDARVRGAVLVNPWVRTEEGRAQVIVRHYYLHRLLSKEFWQLVFSGRFKAWESLRSMGPVLAAYVRGRIQMARHQGGAKDDDLASLPLPVRTAEGLRRFQGRCLLLMSGVDWIAREFDEVTAASRAWDGLLASERVERVDIEGADHTFSRDVWKDAAGAAVLSWVARW